MTTNNFTLSLATEILESNKDDDFKVDFNPLWEWCGYSRKDSAKRTLDNNFELDFDFHIIVEPTTTGIQANPRQTIMLTVDAAKEFAMLAQTSQGKQVRKYFIQAEKALRASIKPQTYIEALEAHLESEKEKERLRQKNKSLAQAVDELNSYSSIIRIAKLNKVSENMFKWQSLKSATKKLGLKIKKTQCPRFGTKNLYPHEAWLDIYPWIKLPENPSNLAVY